MHRHAVLLSIPGLRATDLSDMPRLSALASDGKTVGLSASFPAVTCSVQANLTTGVLPDKHGVVANGFFYRDKGEVEMWTAWNEAVQAPQIWDRLHEADPQLTSAAWFPMLIKGAGADYICTPAPIHNPDGSESLWCYTKPTELYGELRDTFGHFPLMKFWGPLASIESTKWIVDSAVHAAKKYQPRFSYIYLPHLDYAAQKFGPDSPQAIQALTALDNLIGQLLDGYNAAGLTDSLWLAASEYVITSVERVSYPNRLLRENGLLTLNDDGEGHELLDVASSSAWALVDHQFAHVFVKNKTDVPRLVELFRNDECVAEILVGEERAKYALNHDRSGEIVLIAQPDAWFAYYWWIDDNKAPKFARTVDIHRKPGYDPVEMFIDMPTKSTPLDATLVRGSHGLPGDTEARRGVLLCSDANALPKGAGQGLRDIDVAGIVLKNFGVQAK